MAKFDDQVVVKMLGHLGEDELGLNLAVSGVKKTVVGIALTCVGAAFKTKKPLLQVGRGILMAAGIYNTYVGGTLVGSALRPAAEAVCNEGGSEEESEVDLTENETDE